MTLARRYLAKIATNGAGLVLGLVTMSLVPRALGPSAYGSYDFLLNFFREVTGFLDTGSSICYYTKLSQRPDDRGLLRFYSGFALLCGMLMLLGTWMVLQTPVESRIWRNQAHEAVMLGCVLAYCTWVFQVFQKTMDAYALTVKSEMLYLLQRFVVAVFLVTIVWFGWLTLTFYFLFQIAAVCLIIAAWGMLLKYSGLLSNRGVSQPFRAYVREFYDYSHPLLIYAIVGVIAGLADRWILQVYGGSIQQGYFGLANQVAIACFVFTGAMTQLLAREFSRSWGEGNKEEMAALFARYVPMLYAVAAFFCIFISYHAKDIVWLLGGKKYSGGVGVMAIMALYPIHQTYGQLGGAVFYASGKTDAYRNIGVVFMLLGLPMIYFFVAPAGLGLGGIGLALKMVLLQVMWVNVQLWYNAKLLKLKFMQFALYQATVMVAFYLCAMLASWVTTILAEGRISGLVLSGLCYCIFACCVAWMFPTLFSLDREELRRYLKFKR